MRRTLKLFVLPAGAQPGTPPGPAMSVEIEAPREDGLIEAARQVILARGERVRAVSFTPTGLVAYAEAVK